MSSTYRAPTPEEKTWTNPQTPRKFDQRVRVVCKDGQVATAEVTFEDGTPLRNLMRAVVSLESPVVRGENGQTPDGKAYVFVSQFHSEIGQVVYSIAEAVVG